MNAAEFEERLGKGEMRLALVGMSNAGKTKLGKALASAFSFDHVEVDNDIRRELGVSNMDGLADWLGLPETEGYGEREQRYLELEEVHTTRKRPEAGNLVLDTTGSVVHLPDRALGNLRERYFIVHLDVGSEALESLVDKYFAKPKPVVWGEYFSRQAGEPMREALKRSYPELLQARLARYRELAHVSLPTRELNALLAQALLNGIRSKL